MESRDKLGAVLMVVIGVVVVVAMYLIPAESPDLSQYTERCEAVLGDTGERVAFPCQHLNRDQAKRSI